MPRGQCMLLCVRCQNLVPSKVCADAVSTSRVCHDRFLPVGHWFKGGLKVEGAASHRGCRGCVAMRRRGEWTRECPTRGKVTREVREVFSTGFGSEASELGFARKCWSRSKALDAVVRPLHELSLVRLREGRSTREVSYSIFELRENTAK